MKKIFPYISGMFLFVLILGIGYRLDLRDMWKKFLHARAQTHQQTAVLQRLNTQLAHTAHYQANLLHLRHTLQQQQQKLPKATTFQAFLSDVAQYARAAGLTILSVTARKSETVSPYILMPAQFILRGNYDQFLHFLSALSIQQYKLTFTHVTMTRESATAAASFNNPDIAEPLIIHISAIFYGLPP